MTTEELIMELESAIRKDDRWAISNLRSKHKDFAWKEACRHADNLVYASKLNNESLAESSRQSLIKYIAEIRSHA